MWTRAEEHCPRLLSRRPFWLVVLGGLIACGAPQQNAVEPPQLPPATGGAETAATPGSAPPAGDPLPAQVRAIVDAPDRSEQDRALDAGRKPGELLAFVDLSPGMKVAEIGAGIGYTAELLARTVGASGTVYGVNSPWVLERFAEQPWSQRLSTPAMQNVVRLDRPFDDPFPDEVEGLDLVMSALIYHDLFWMDVDRAAMNADVFRALKPGGKYVVIDHAAESGSGARDVQSLHRIEAATVRAEIEQAGFRFVREGAFLRNPQDARDWNAAPTAAAERRGQSDRFVLEFVKP